MNWNQLKFIYGALHKKPNKFARWAWNFWLKISNWLINALSHASLKWSYLLDLQNHHRALQETRKIYPCLRCFPLNFVATSKELQSISRAFLSAIRWPFPRSRARFEQWKISAIRFFFNDNFFFFQTILTLSKLFPLIFQTFPLNEYKLFRFPWLNWFGWLVGEQRLFPTICDQSEPSRTWVGACVPVIVSAGILPSKWRKLHLLFRIPLRNLHLILNFKDVWLLDNHGTSRLWHLIILRENCCQELMLRYEISLLFFSLRNWSAFFFFQ